MKNPIALTRWVAERIFFFAPATEYVTQWISSFREFPPRAKPGTFGIDQVMEKMTASPSGKDQERDDQHRSPVISFKGWGGTKGGASSQMLPR